MIDLIAWKTLVGNHDLMGATFDESPVPEDMGTDAAVAREKMPEVGGFR